MFVLSIILMIKNNIFFHIFLFLWSNIEAWRWYLMVEEVSKKNLKR
jgi:hypothetical protein